MTPLQRNPSIDDVLDAVVRNNIRFGPDGRSYTAYIADALRCHKDFRLVRTDYVKSRLQQACDAGLLERTTHVTGSYGYSWWLTEKGRAHLLKPVRTA